MNKSTSQNNTFAFFGTDAFSITVLEQLENNNLIPALIVCAPDRKQGRGMELTAPPIKMWASERNIPVLQPEQHDQNFIATLQKDTEVSWDFFIVTSYGIIVPQAVIDIPKYGVLNVHPSLLPKHRGATPIETAMLLDEKETGVTVMLVDKKMDHGPILSQEIVTYESWPLKPEVSINLATIGGVLLAKTIPAYIAGEIIPQTQDHKAATFTKKIQKQDGDITDTKTDREKYLKYLAFNPWPGIFFFTEQGARIKITKARFENNSFIIERIIPEGKKEQDYTSQ